MRTLEMSWEEFKLEFNLIGDGMHFVNRIGYIITEIPANPGVTYIIDHDPGVSEELPDEALAVQP